MDDLTRVEFEKFFSNRRVYLILVLGIFMEIIVAMQMRTVMFEGFHKSVYQYYTAELAGEHSGEKKAYIEAECERMKALLAKEKVYENQYRNDEISAEEYHRISEEIKTAKFRIKTLEYLKEKTEYYDASNHRYSYFYDVGIGDFIAHMGNDYIALIVVLFLIIPLYTDDFHAKTVPMIRSSKNGREKLFFARLKVAAVVSGGVSILCSAVEFLTKFFRYDLGDLFAKTGSLMIDKTVVMPEFLLELPIWEYIVLYDLSRLAVSVLFGVAGLFIAKICL